MIALPELLEIKPLTRPPVATITVPGSKSITNRALILAALARGKCTLRGALWADDTRVMVDSLQRLGFAVKVSPDLAEEFNRTIEVEGHGGEIPVKQAELYVGNAGTAARFLTAFACLGIGGEYRISGDPRMHQRPMGDLLQALRQIGVPGKTGLEIVDTDGRLPVTIRPGRRPLHESLLVVSGHTSSQFASALLLISRQMKLDIRMAEPEPPFGYVDMTRRMLTDVLGPYDIEPDLSGASYFAAAESLCNGRIHVTGWPKQSLQIDGRFLQFLPPPSTISREHDLGDSVLTLAICALFGKQPMRLTEASRLREQECDRLHAMVAELKKVGAHAEEHNDGFTVWPAAAGQLHGADIETYNDHRMAMCFAVLGLKIPGIRLKNPSCVSKTFPNFFDKLKQLGAELIDAGTGNPI